MYKAITTAYIMDNLTKLKKARENNMYLINKVEIKENNQLPTNRRNSDVIFMVKDNNYENVEKSKVLYLYVIQPINPENYENLNDSWTTITDKENLTEFGYVKMPNKPFYVKYREITYLELEEEMELSVSWLKQKILGKKGDYLIITGNDNFNLISNETFNKIYTKLN